MLVAGPAFAQQNPPPAATPPAQETKPAAPELTKSGKPKARDVREDCRAEAKTQGLKGAERRKAVEDCFIKARPDLAAKEKARAAVKEECRQDPKLKDMDKDARKAAIKECVKSKK